MRADPRIDREAGGAEELLADETFCTADRTYSSAEGRLAKAGRAAIVR
jgi:hypothetical protein